MTRSLPRGRPPALLRATILYYTNPFFGPGASPISILKGGGGQFLLYHSASARCPKPSFLRFPYAQSNHTVTRVPLGRNPDLPPSRFASVFDLGCADGYPSVRPGFRLPTPSDHQQATAVRRLAVREAVRVGSTGPPSGAHDSLPSPTNHSVLVRFCVVTSRDPNGGG